MDVSMKDKAKQCIECTHFELRWKEAECFMGHKPRFYQPRDPLHTDWGWKRRCDDFMSHAEYERWRWHANEEAAGVSA